jgi:hypothetical protein
MTKGLKTLAIGAVLCASIMSTSAVAFADATMDFKVISAKVDENGTLVATGSFVNTGDKSIDTVDKVSVKVHTANANGDVTTVGDHVFSNITVHLVPGEEKEVTLEFTGSEVPEDAVTWEAEEGDWEFTYFE